MRYRKDTTLQWIWFWGILTLIFAFLTEETKSSWTFFFAGVTFLILLIGTVVGFIKFGKRKRIRRRLGLFLQEGDNIRVQCANQKQPPPEKEALEWAEKVAIYLVRYLGEEYRARFYNSDGLPMAATSLSGEYARIQSFVRFRIARLHQFIAEV